MKKKINKRILLIVITINCSLLINNINAQTIKSKKNDFISFSVKILSATNFENGNYSLFVSVTNKQIKITYKRVFPKAKDTILLLQKIQTSDSIQSIGKMNINKLKKEYSNPCLDDGFHYTVTIKKGNKIKSVEIYNYYQEDIGRIIYLINSLLPVKYKVWYDKEGLIGDYKRCKIEMNAAQLDSINN